MTDTKKPLTAVSGLTYDDVRAVSPALEHYTKRALLDGLWKRPELSPRDRSVVAVTALIARIQTVEMPFHFSLALDNGVKPAELSEQQLWTGLGMLPFGKQQDILDFPFDDKSRRAVGPPRTLFIEDGVV